MEDDQNPYKRFINYLKEDIKKSKHKLYTMPRYRRAGKTIRSRRKKKAMKLVEKWPVGPPESITCKLPYVMSEPGNAFTGSTGGSTYIRLNSLYDPEYAVGGEQPLYYDQFTAMYDKYRVLGCKYSITVWNNSDVRTKVCVMPSISAALGFNSIEDAMAQPWSKHRHISIQNNANSQSTITGYINIRKVLGKKSLYDDIDASLYNTDPAQPVYLYLLAEANDQTTNINLGYTIKCTFYAELYKKKQLNQS